MELRTRQADVPTLARRYGLTASYVTGIVRPAFLSPAVVDTILAGTQLATINGGTLTAPDAIPADSAKQRALRLALHHM